MTRILPVFKGYTVDVRLKEFRKIKMDKLPEFVPFVSEKGAKLFYDFYKTKVGREEVSQYISSREEG